MTEIGVGHRSDIARRSLSQAPGLLERSPRESAYILMSALLSAILATCLPRYCGVFLIETSSRRADLLLKWGRQKSYAADQIQVHVRHSGQAAGKVEDVVEEPREGQRWSGVAGTSHWISQTLALQQQQHHHHHHRHQALCCIHAFPNAAVLYQSHLGQVKFQPCTLKQSSLHCLNHCCPCHRIHRNVPA